MGPNNGLLVYSSGSTADIFLDGGSLETCNYCPSMHAHICQLPCTGSAAEATAIMAAEKLRQDMIAMEIEIKEVKQNISELEVGHAERVLQLARLVELEKWRNFLHGEMLMIDMCVCENYRRGCHLKPHEDHRDLTAVLRSKRMHDVFCIISRKITVACVF
jgi:hypothetical protein